MQAVNLMFFLSWISIITSQNENIPSLPIAPNEFYSKPKNNNLEGSMVNSSSSLEKHLRDLDQFPSVSLPETNNKTSSKVIQTRNIGHLVGGAASAVVHSFARHAKFNAKKAFRKAKHHVHMQHMKHGLLLAPNPMPESDEPDPVQNVQEHRHESIIESPEHQFHQLDNRKQTSFSRNVEMEPIQRNYNYQEYPHVIPYAEVIPPRQLFDMEKAKQILPETPVKNLMDSPIRQKVSSTYFENNYDKPCIVLRPVEPVQNYNSHLNPSSNFYQSQNEPFARDAQSSDFENRETVGFITPQREFLELQNWMNHEARSHSEQPHQRKANPHLFPQLHSFHSHLDITNGFGKGSKKPLSSFSHSIDFEKEDKDIYKKPGAYGADLDVDWDHFNHGFGQDSFSHSDFHSKPSHFEHSSDFHFNAHAYPPPPAHSQLHSSSYHSQENDFGHPPKGHSYKSGGSSFSANFAEASVNHDKKHDLSDDLFNSLKNDKTGFGASYPVQITINKQENSFVNTHPGSTKSQNIAVAQVTGEHNSISQSQTASKVNKFEKSFGNFNFQADQSQNIANAEVSGSGNAVSQSQSVNRMAIQQVQPDLVGSPYLINVPSSTRFERDVKDRKKKIAKKQLYMEEVREKAIHKLNSTPRHKRQVPFVRLLTDPNVKLDVPQTVQNIGTFVRNSIEDKKAPLHHIKHAIGSAKDAMISSMKIPPHNFIISSKYRIIDEKQARTPRSLSEDPLIGAINPALISTDRAQQSRKSERIFNGADGVVLVDPMMDTYHKVGNILKESIRSGKDALTHAHDVYDNAKRAVHSTRHAIPKVLLPLSRIPAVQNEHPFLQNRRDKAMLLTPRLVHLKEDRLGGIHASEENDEFVGAGRILNSLGISDPGKQQMGIRRVVFHTPQIKVPPALDHSPIVGDKRHNNVFHKHHGYRRSKSGHRLARRYHKPRSVDNDQYENPTQIKDTIKVIDNMRNIVGASNLRELVSRMKDELRNKVDEATETIQARIQARRPLISPLNRVLSPQQSRQSTEDSDVKVERRFQGDTEKNNFESTNLKQANPRNSRNYQFLSRNTRLRDSTDEESEEDVRRFLTDLFRKSQFNNRTNSKDEDLSLNENVENYERNENNVKAVFSPKVYSTPKVQRRNKYQSCVDASGKAVQCRQNHSSKSKQSHKVSAVNPIVYKKMFNETLHRKKEKIDTKKIFLPAKGMESPEEEDYDYQNEVDDDEEAETTTDSVGISMDIKGKLLKPFLGLKGEEEEEDNVYVNNNYDYADTRYKEAERQERNLVNM